MERCIDERGIYTGAVWHFHQPGRACCVCTLLCLLHLGLGFSGVLGIQLALLPLASSSSGTAVCAARASLDSTLSREAAFLANNLLLLAIAFVTLWGVVFPLISEVFRGVTVTVGAPFYDRVNGPLFLVLIFLMGVGPLMPWRTASWLTLRRAVQTPGLVALGTVALLLAFRVTHPFALMSYGLCAFVAAGIFREWAKGTMSRRRNGLGYPMAFLGLIASNRPRYGGLHRAPSSRCPCPGGGRVFPLRTVQRDVILAPGESVDVEGYRIEYTGTRTQVRSDRTEFLNDLQVSQGNGEPRPMMAWRAFYPAQNIAATRAAIRSTPIEDLYIVSSESLDDGRVAFRILVNPLVWWMWLAGPILVLGNNRCVVAAADLHHRQNAKAG